MKSIDETPLNQEGNFCDSKLALCDPKELYEKLTDDHSGIVGRKRELKLILSAICAGKSVLLEGPPGTSKSTILHGLCCTLGLCLHYVEGNADLTASKLVGYFDPAAVLQSGYIPENFNEGVLTRAMETGGILYIEDINRVPPDALNTLVTVLSEREIHIPRYGMIEAHADFRVVASLSIFDHLGPTRLSRAILDRFVKIKLDYQSEEEELEIVKRITQCEEPWLVELGVKIGRATREHPELKVGASIRGAIDFVRLATDKVRFEIDVVEDALLQIAYLSFSAKIKKKASCERTEEDIIEELFRVAVLGGSLEDVLRKRPEGEGDDAKLSLMRGPEPDWDLVDAIRQKRLFKMMQTAEEGDLGATKVGQALSKIPDEEMFQDVFNGPLSPELYVLIRHALDKRRRGLARELATQIIVNRARNLTFFGLRQGDRKRFRFDGDGQIDIDRTLENVVEKGSKNHVETDDIIVTKRERVKRACLLMIDASESMIKQKIGLAALAAAILSLRYSAKNDFYGVLAFHSQPFLIKPIDQDLPVDRVIDDILTLDASGMTAFKAAFKDASHEFSKIAHGKKEIFLLTDGVLTYGEDPLPFIRHNGNISRVNVLYLDPGNYEFAKELAYKGQIVKIDDWPSIVRGINQIMNTPY